MSSEEQLPPNYAKLDVALRSIGYSFEAAVADIVDNSIDAGASHVRVRLLTRSDGHVDLAIWDDGDGMSADTLREALRFGSDISSDLDRLGKFGLGLKLASLSQAREVKVVSRRSGKTSGRAWLEHGIATGFTSTVFTEAEAAQIALQTVPDMKFRPSGTVVWWSGLYRVGRAPGGADELAQRLMRRLENYLALAFHRFLGGSPRKVAITVDILQQTPQRLGIPAELEGLNPFGYPHSGDKRFPALLTAAGEYAGRLKIRAHVWPPNSTAAEYRLPGGANARQGFYFYRNNRLIQGGGWNDLREVEPHASLARIEIDIPSDLDIDVSLDVKKTEIQLPQRLTTSIQQAKSKTGVDFKEYLRIADSAYRTRKPADSELPLIPAAGLPAELVKYLRDELRHKGTTKHRPLRIAWKRLEEDEFFMVDRDRGVLNLNLAFRRRLLNGMPGSGVDLPVVKCLLFLLLKDTLGSQRMGSNMRKELELANRVLIQAIRYERMQE
jgi:hypothetical protein